MLPTLLAALAAIVVADFVSGLGHWFEDTYFRHDTPLIGRVIRANIRHHVAPWMFARHPWWVNIGSTAALVAPLALILALTGHLTLWWGAVLGLLLISNLGHAWTHRPRREVPRIVQALWKARLLQTPEHHRGHHRGAKNTRYCVITNALNPVLDGLGFWRGLERMIAKLTGVTPRPDPTVLGLPIPEGVLESARLVTGESGKPPRGPRSERPRLS
ncbi:MAG: fatty acid desaturase CarF family protein [Acidobacteriota bacterium]